MRQIAPLLVCSVALVGVTLSQQDPPGPADVGAKTWIGHYRDVEEYLRTAECVRMDDVSRSMPDAKRCVLRPGGPVARMIWKPLIPSVRRGFRESGKADIAAYALNKLLKLDMIPPVVDRELQGYKGVATFWVENVVDATDGASPSASARVHWEQQRIRMSMFDMLIGNKDRNTGNILRDAAWNMILIDHSRAFGAVTELSQPVGEIDQEYWARIEKLTRPQLDGALGKWLEPDEIAAILERRNKMRAGIKKQ